MWKINIYADKPGEQLRRISQRSVKLLLIDCIFRRSPGNFGPGVRFLGVSYTLAIFCVSDHYICARTDNEMHGTVCGRVDAKLANCRCHEIPDIRRLAGTTSAGT